MPNNFSNHTRFRADLAFALSFFLIALIVRIIYLLKVNPPFGNDDERYIFVAQSLLAQDFENAIHYHYPPGSSFLVLLVQFFTRNFETACRAVAISANSLTIIPVYFLALMIFGRRTAILSASFFAFRFFNYSASDLAEQVEMLFLYSALLSGLYALKGRRPIAFFITGALFGISFLTKPEAWAFFLLFGLISLASGFWRRAGLKKMLVSLFLLVVGYFLITGFYLASYYCETGHFSFIPEARTLFVLHNLYHPQGLQYYLQEDQTGAYTLIQRIMEGDKIPVQPAISEIIFKNWKRFPSIYFERFWSNFYRFIVLFFLQAIAPWVWPFLVLAGLLPQRGWERARWELYLHSFALIPILLVPLFTSGFPRFFFTLIPWFMMVLGRGAERIVRLANPSELKIRLKKIQAPIDLCLVFIALALSAIFLIKNSPRNEAYWSEVAYRKQIAEKVKKMLPAGCKFMAELENQSLWYLAGVPPKKQVILPFDPLPDIISYAEQTQAKYLIFHPSFFPNRYLSLNEILKPDFSFPGLNLVFRDQSPNGNIYVIYEITSVRCGKN